MVVVKVEGYRGELPVGVNLADRNSFERPKSHEFVRLLRLFCNVLREKPVSHLHGTARIPIEALLRDSGTPWRFLRRLKALNYNEKADVVFEGHLYIVI